MSTKLYEISVKVDDVQKLNISFLGRVIEGKLVPLDWSWSFKSWGGGPITSEMIYKAYEATEKFIEEFIS